MTQEVQQKSMLSIKKELKSQAEKIVEKIRSDLEDHLYYYYKAIVHDEGNEFESQYQVDSELAHLIAEKKNLFNAEIDYLHEYVYAKKAEFHYQRKLMKGPNK